MAFALSRSVTPGSPGSPAIIADFDSDLVLRDGKCLSENLEAHIENARVAMSKVPLQASTPGWNQIRLNLDADFGDELVDGIIEFAISSYFVVKLPAGPSAAAKGITAMFGSIIGISRNSGETACYPRSTLNTLRPQAKISLSGYSRSCFNLIAVASNVKEIEVLSYPSISYQALHSLY